jgi:sugar diacid utilization regulator
VDALEDYKPPDGIRVAFGAPAHGVAGFRSSHADALQAARIVSLAPGTAAPVTGYPRVELVSLLATDLPRARAFVFRQLGPLASPDEPAERLRETVIAFLAAGGSATRVAQELYVHQNTVAYRVKRAEELLGRRVTESPIELTCALTLDAASAPPSSPTSQSANRVLGRYAARAPTGSGAASPSVRSTPRRQPASPAVRVSSSIPGSQRREMA